MLCFFCIPVCLLVSLNSAIFYMISSLFLLIVLFDHPIFLNTLSYFVSLLFLEFNLLLILVCFVSFSIPSQCLFHFSFVFFKCSFTLSVYSHLMLSSFNNLTLKDSSWFIGAFLLLLFNHSGAKFTLAHNNYSRLRSVKTYQFIVNM